jgi:hypothetical protein
MGALKTVRPLAVGVTVITLKSSHSLSREDNKTVKGISCCYET